MTQAVVVAFVALASSLTASCERLDVMEKFYPDATAVANAGVVEKGWIPEFLPATAKNIKLQANLDTNEVWLSFSNDADDQSFLEKSCRQTNAKEVILPRKVAGDWWPRELVLGGDLANTSLVVYGCGSGTLLAVNSNLRQYYYWRRSA